MAASTSNLYYGGTTIAAFNNWAGALMAALSAAGWVQTSDTGQTNFSTTTTLPTGSGTYQVWKMADSLASSFPVYMRIDASHSNNQPTLQFQLGTGSNGAGTLSNATITNSGSTGTSDNTTTTYPCYFSGTTSSFRACFYPTTNNEMAFAVERSKNSDGSDSSKFVVMFNNFNGNNRLWILPNPTIAQPDGTSMTSMPFPDTNATSLMVGNEIGVMPIIPVFGIVGSPMMGVAIGKMNDFQNQQQFTMTAFGASHNYIAMNPGSSGNLRNFGGNGQYDKCLIMLYE